MQDPDQIFIQEEFGDFSAENQDIIKECLDFNKDKWALRLVLLQFFFLGEEMNDIAISRAIEKAYGSENERGLIHRFNLSIWGAPYFPREKDNQLIDMNVFTIGKENARNIPAQIAKQQILMQRIGKNYEFTPAGTSVANLIYYKFLRENHFNLKNLASLASLDVSEENQIQSFLPDSISIENAIDMHLIKSANRDGMRRYESTKYLKKLVQFLLDHPYFDSKSRDVLKKYFEERLSLNLLSFLKERTLVSILLKNQNKNGIPSNPGQLDWIYQLEIDNFNHKSRFRDWFNQKCIPLDLECNKNPSIDNSREEIPFFIIKSGPGSGKSIWMLQKALKTFDSGNCLPFLIPMGKFSILKKEKGFSIFYDKSHIVDIAEVSLIDTACFERFYKKLLNQLTAESQTLFWIETYLKLLKNQTILLYFDGWDELEPFLRPFFVNFLKYITKNSKNNIQALISTRYLESHLKTLCIPSRDTWNWEKYRNLVSLGAPSRVDIRDYFRQVGISYLLEEENYRELKIRFHDEPSPLDLWMLALFPSLEELPKNRADLYERWLKYEVIIEIQDRLKTPLVNIRTNTDIDEAIKSAQPITRPADGKQYTIIQLLYGPVKAIIPKDNKYDFALFSILPRIVHNRLGNPKYFFSYEQMIAANPLLTRFIHEEFTGGLRPNFRIINPHYDHYLAALHCFNNYLKNRPFSLLGNEKVGQLFREILQIRVERIDFDQENRIPDELIILRNRYNTIPAFNDTQMRFPLNQTGPFIFKTRIKNFIDVYRDQVLLFYWQRKSQGNVALLNKSLIERFRAIEKTLVRKPKQTKEFLASILFFQDKYIGKDADLSEIYQAISIETPFLIPILIYAFEQSEKEMISSAQIEQLEESDFFDLPWVKFWIFREIIRKYPERIIELAEYAISHTKRYLLKFCALNIISPLQTSIPPENFRLSLEFFRRVRKQVIREIMLFNWAGHYLNSEQLVLLKKLERELTHERFQLVPKDKQKRKEREAHFRKYNALRFDLHYLLVLHGEKPPHPISELEDISPAKICYLLSIQTKNKTFEETEIRRFIKKFPEDAIFLLEKQLKTAQIDIRSLSLEFEPESIPIIEHEIDNWWKEHSPKTREVIELFFQEVTPFFEKSTSWRNNQQFKQMKSRIKHYFGNFIHISGEDQELVYQLSQKTIDGLIARERREPGKKIDEGLGSGTEVYVFFKIFYSWLLNCENLHHILEITRKYESVIELGPFLIITRKKFPDSNELLDYIREIVHSNRQRYILREEFVDLYRKNHPHVRDLKKKGTLWDTESGNLLLMALPETEVLEILESTFDLEKNKDLFNYVYNLSILGTPTAYHLIAKLWDTHFVDVNAPPIERLQDFTFLGDRSYFIWLGIPYEHLEAVYPFLQNPIAQIFFLVCLSIHDTFKPHELNIKHSDFRMSSYILEKLSKFTPDQINEALFLFFESDWNIQHFQFLLYFTPFSKDIAIIIRDLIHSGEFSIRDVFPGFKSIYLVYQKQEKMTIQTKKFDFLRAFLKYQPKVFRDIVLETRSSGNLSETVSLFEMLLHSKLFEGLKIAKQIWENQTNLFELPGNDENPNNFVKGKEKKPSERIFETKLSEIVGFRRFFRIKMSPAWRKRFFQMLSNPVSRIRFVFHSILSLFKKSDSYRVRIDCFRRSYSILKREIRVWAPEPVLEPVFHYFDIYLQEFIEEITPESDSHFDDWEHYSEEERDQLEFLEDTKSTLSDSLSRIPLDIPQLLKQFERMGDSFDFIQTVELFLEQSEEDHPIFIHKYIHLCSIPEANRKLVRKYLLYIILHQREILYPDLEHDEDWRGTESNEVVGIDEGISLDNLFTKVLVNSIAHGYLADCLETLRLLGRKDLSELFKNFIKMQIDLDATKFPSSFRSVGTVELHFPLVETIRKVLSEKELDQVRFLFYSRKFFDVIKTVLFSLEQFLNGFKFSPAIDFG